MHDDRQDRSELDHDLEGRGGRVVGEAEHVSGELEVAGRRDRQVFGETLDDAQKDGDGDGHDEGAPTTGAGARGAPSDRLAPVAEETTSLPLLTRLWFAWLCFFRVLFDGAFAGRLWSVRLPPR